MPSPSSTPDLTATVTSATTMLLAARAKALTSADKAAWMATVADSTSAYGVRQARVYGVMSALGVRGWQVASVEDVHAVTAAVAGSSTSSPTPSSTSDWQATVTQTYSIARFDAAPRTYRTVLTLRPAPAGAGGGWALADDGLDPTGTPTGAGSTAGTATAGATGAGGATAPTTAGFSDPQPWDLPGAQVVRSGSTVVVGNQPRAMLQEYLTLADTAYPRVSAVWGTSQPAVLVAPATLPQLGEQLDRTGSDPTAGLRQIAAVTDGPVSRGSAATSDRVYLNPDAFARLTAEGRQAVVTHELTHVAVRATTTYPVPTWLSEGFADDIGFTGLSVPDAVVAKDLVDVVRAGKGPTTLPGDASFTAGGSSGQDLGVTYNAAWLAVKRMVARFGMPKTVALYRAVASHPTDDDPAVALNAAFVSVLGTTQEAFTPDWLATLRQLAG